jgi:hypothetical protein
VAPTLYRKPALRPTLPHLLQRMPRAARTVSQAVRISRVLASAMGIMESGMPRARRRLAENGHQVIAIRVRPDA